MRIQPSNINYIPKVIERKVAGCPHGSPAGTCPICLGMGGGGGGGSSIKPKPTPKELGLLTWADLLPGWYAMLAANQRKLDNARLEKKLETNKLVEFQLKLYQIANNFINSKIMPLIKSINCALVAPLTKAVAQFTQAINNFVTELKTQVMNQLGKMTAAVNEKIMQMLDKLKNSAEILKNVMEIFVSNLKDKEKAIKDYLSSLANKVKKKLMRIIEASENSFEEVEHDEEELLKPYEVIEDEQ